MHSILSCQHNKSTIRSFFHQTNEFARNILHTNILYLKASTAVKIATFFGEIWGVDSMDMKWALELKYKPETYDSSLYPCTI